jgi:hypothetical protein
MVTKYVLVGTVAAALLLGMGVAYAEEKAKPETPVKVMLPEPAAKAVTAAFPKASKVCCI